MIGPDDFRYPPRVKRRWAIAAAPVIVVGGVVVGVLLGVGVAIDTVVGAFSKPKPTIGSPPYDTGGVV